MQINTITRVFAKNSTDFVGKVFKLYDNKALFAIDRTGHSLDAFESLKIENTINSEEGHGWLYADHKLSNSDQPAQIVFTSGTEGLPKAILLSYKNLSDVIIRLNNVMGIDSSIREYVGVPVTYSFGLGRCRAVAAVGGGIFIPSMGFNPFEIRQMLEKEQINSISAVPSMLRILLDSPEMIGNLGEKLRWMEVGSQYMAADEKRNLIKLFPNARIIQHYGLTEASRTTFLNISSINDDFIESVGCPTENVTIKLSEKGNVCINGNHVAIGKIDGQGKVESLRNDDGWLETKDQGEIRNGHLWYLGRSDDQINIGGLKLYPDKLEHTLTQLFKCSGQIAIAGVFDRLRGMKVLLTYRNEIKDKIHQIESALKQILNKQGIQAGSISLFHLEQFPVTETGKVQRKKISEIYEQSEINYSQNHAQYPEKNIKLTKEEQVLASLWAKILGPDCVISPEDSFLDIGGDSLSTLQIVMKMEKMGYRYESIQAMLRGRPLSYVAKANLGGDTSCLRDIQLEKLPKETVVTWSLNALRGLLVSIVVLGHWGPGLWKRLFGENSFKVDEFLTPVYRMGTPGFAIIFGIGVGYYFVHNNIGEREAPVLGTRIQSIFYLVFFAWLLLSGLHLVENLIDGQQLTGLLLGNSLYNILCYYTLAIASIPIWNKMLVHGKMQLIYTAIFWSIIFWVINLIMVAILPKDQIPNILEWPRLMIIAKYGYFRLGSIVFLGIAIGSFLRQERSLEDIRDILTKFGALIFFGGLFTTIEFMSWDQQKVVTVVPTSMVFIYLGIECMIFGMGTFIINNKNNNKMMAVIEMTMNHFIVLGILALPIFVFHESVIPIKNILINIGINETASYMTSIGGFFFIIILLGLKVLKFYLPKFTGKINYFLFKFSVRK